MLWARPTKTCRRSSSCPTIAALPPTARRIGVPASCPRSTRGRCLRPGTANPIADLHPPAGHRQPRPSRPDDPALSESSTANTLATRPGDSRLEARIRSYELAARMQLSAPEALDISGEPKHVLKMYGLDDAPATFPAEINAQEETVHFGRKCLVARRLLERGVRFVQIWSGCDNGFPRRNWDSHEDIARDHGPMALGMARATAALILDLKQRGLLDDTLDSLDDRIRPHAVRQGGKGPRPQPVRLHQLAGRRRHPRRHRHSAPATNGATNRPTAIVPPRATTSMPRCCTCWASTTSGSRFGTTASTGD